MNEEFTKYGLPGIVIGGLCFAVIKLWAFIATMRKEHKEDSAEWRKVVEKQFEEQNKTTKDNTGILQGLKTLLENRKHEH